VTAATVTRREPDVRLSELTDADFSELKLMLQRCSASTLRGRFGTFSTTAAEDYLCSAREADKLTVVARSARGRIVGTADLYFGTQPELAALVEDGWQYRGVGRQLIRRACSIAARTGVTTLYAQINTINVAARRCLLRACDYTRITYQGAGETTVEIPLNIRTTT
jgi:N-acetylglutamate synthase-like GNAT family acetyltransferase